MKLNGMLLVLTVVNLMLLGMLLARGQRAEARSELSVLRGRGLEIVDDQGSAVFIDPGGTSLGRLTPPEGWSVSGAIAWSAQAA